MMAKHIVLGLDGLSLELFKSLYGAEFRDVYPEEYKYLLEKGADRNVYSFERKSALDYAYERNNKEIINLLKSDYDR